MTTVPQSRLASVIFPRHGLRLDVPVAWSPEAWHHGLRGALREEDAFLLFPTHLFPRTSIAMTMTGMSVPLDFIFIANDKIDHIRRNVAPGTQLVEPPRWVPWVLEVPAGLTRNADMRLGDRALVYAQR